MLMPIFSEGGVILRETYCMLPKNHDGPHRNPEGSIMVNQEQSDFELEMGRKLRNQS